MKYIIAILLLSGCVTAEKSFQKALDKDRDYVNVQTRLLWPCVTTEVKTTVDSSAYKAYRDEIEVIREFYEELLKNVEPEKITDTITLVDSAKCNELKAAYKRNEGRYMEKIRLLNSKVSELTQKLNTAPPVVVNNTKKEKDMAEVEAANKERDLAVNKMNDVQGQNKRRGRWNLYLIIALIASLALNYFLIRKR